MIGIIGGSGLYRLPGLNVIREMEPETPFGKIAGPLKVFEAGCGKQGVFLCRHGEGHRWPAHRVPHRANLWAMYELGVDSLVSFSSCGAVDATLTPGDYLVLDNFINAGGIITFYDGPSEVRVPDRGDLVSKYINEGRAVHLDFTYPCCHEMRQVIISVLGEMGLPTRGRGTYLQTHGPRLESAAEIVAARRQGAHAVGMTLAHEATLARELGMCFAGVAVVTNMAAGMAGTLSAREIDEMMHEKAREIELVVEEVTVRMPATPSCECRNQLREALM